MKVIFELVSPCFFFFFIIISSVLVEISPGLCDRLVLPSPTSNGHPPSGWLIVLLVSTMATGMPFDAPAA